jgi:hypothetical protein
MTLGGPSDYGDREEEPDATTDDDAASEREAQWVATAVRPVFVHRTGGEPGRTAVAAGCVDPVMPAP